MSLSKRDYNWFLIVASGWITLVAAAMFPASFWLDVKNVHVMDAPVGTSPMVVVRRDINRDIFSRRFFTVVKKQEYGPILLMCKSNGVEVDFRASTTTATAMSLTEWLEKPCTLPPGSYFLRALWMLDVPMLPQKEVRAESNEFKIY